MNSPSDINSRNATPAGGQNESINSSPVHGPRPARIEGWPKVAGYCPACGTASLFLGSGGWVTCSLDKCPNPTAVADLIEHRPDLSVPAPQPNPSSEPKVTVTGVDGVTRIVQGVEGEIPDGVEYTFGPCDTCGEMFCEHERVSQPVVPSARVDLGEIEARANAAAPGPWQAFYGSVDENGQQCYYVGRPTATVSIDDITGDGMPKGDAEFVAHARSDVPALVAEVRRLRETLAMANYACEQANRLTAGQKKLTDKAAAERDAARAEAERLREAWRGESEHGHSNEACCSCCYQVNAERAEAARVREALQAVRDLHCECTTGNCACGGGPGWCHGCDGGWPCSTVRALDAALGSHPDESENPTKEMDHA